MKSNSRRVWLTAAVILLLSIAAGWFGIIHHRDKRALAGYKLRLLEQGEKLSIEELIPRVAPVDGDGTAIFSAAVTQIRGRDGGALGTNPPSAMRMVAHGRAMIGWRQPEVRDAHATNSWAEIRAELEADAEALALLHQLIERPWIDHRLDYTLGHRMNSGSRIGYTYATRRLQAALLCSLRDGNVQDAVMHARAMLALVKGFADERLILSHLTRMAIGSLAVTAHWELLQSPQANDAGLLALQREWEALDFLQPAERALEMERAFGILAAEEMRNSGRVFQQLSAPWLRPPSAAAIPTNWTGQAWQFARDSWNKTRNQARRATWRVAWADADQLVVLRGMQAMLGALREARSTGALLPALLAQDRQLEALGLIGDSSSAEIGAGDGLSERDTRILLSQNIVPLHRFSHRVMVMEAARNKLVTAIALKRHQLRHGNLPVDLAALTPEFLDVVPRDPVDGQPLRYRPSEDGSFRLYSIGEDGVDNGGDPRPANEASKSLYWGKGRDWVWPQAASAEEVEVFHRKMGEPNR